MKYTLRQLEVFLATAHHQNITKAAADLSMSQSAASGALRDLESQFDVQLFDRVGKRLQTNEHGRLLRPKVEALISQAKEIENTLTKHSSLGEIRVGATLTIGNYLAVGLVNKFMQQSKDARAKLIVANMESIAEQLINFDLDIGLLEGDYHHPDLQISPWKDDELEVFCSPTHPLAYKKTLTDQDLLDANWILRETGSGTRQAFDHGMRGLMPLLNISLELEHTEAIKHAVQENLGISCLSKIALKEAFQQKTLTPLKFPKRNFSRKFYIAYHKQKYLSPGLTYWMTLCGLDMSLPVN